MDADFAEAQAARNGIWAATLAANAFAGAPTALEGEGGFYNAFTGNNRGVWVDGGGHLFIADQYNARVREVSGGTINTAGLFTANAAAVVSIGGVTLDRSTDGSAGDSGAPKNASCGVRTAHLRCVLHAQKKSTPQKKKRATF